MAAKWLGRLRPARRVRLLLGDQLNSCHSWFDETDADTLYLLAELHQETSYCVHHIQKVAAFFAAMQAFAAQLDQQGHSVLHLTLDDTSGLDLPGLISLVLQETGACRFEYQSPDEYRLQQQLAQLVHELPDAVEVSCCDSEHFLLAREEISQYLPDSGSPLMETFYRKLRKRTGYLMRGSQPEGNQWNFDKENRQDLPDEVDIPAPLTFANPVGEILDRIERHSVQTMGRISERSLGWPVTRQQSLQLLEFFVGHCLADFGRYQDALSDRGWSLFHSRLSFSLNSKMLSPAEVCERAIQQWQGGEDINLAQVEGFVRQIIGWREYMRGIYWTRMPDYANRNALEHQRDLPAWYWNGETGMKCLHQAVGQSLDHAYAHHIQRLMVTGNFALLAGVHPDQVDAWYLGVYIDAIEWVEITNTRGMSQYADGGVVATKPYISSANYIDKMGSHCGTCRYDPKKRWGEGSCPFNSLYWHFIDRHAGRLQGNRRMSMVLASWKKRKDEDRQAILETAEHYLQNIDNL